MMLESRITREPPASRTIHGAMQMAGKVWAPPYRAHGNSTWHTAQSFVLLMKTRRPNLNVGANTRRNQLFVETRRPNLNVGANTRRDQLFMRNMRMKLTSI